MRAMDLPSAKTIAVAWAVATGGTLTVLACTTDYQQGKGDPAYGPPNGLQGKEPPGNTAEQLKRGGSSGGEGGSSGGPACVAAGGTLVEAGAPCAVSFKNDILPAFNTASCNTTGSCHGGDPPPNAPRIDPGNGEAMWQEFQTFTIGGKPFINPCSTDPAASTMGCNVSKTGTCGTLMPPQLGLDPATVTKITDWLTCGSPNN